MLICFWIYTHGYTRTYGHDGTSITVAQQWGANKTDVFFMGNHPNVWWSDVVSNFQPALTPGHWWFSSFGWVPVANANNRTDSWLP